MPVHELVSEHCEQQSGSLMTAKGLKKLHPSNEVIRAADDGERLEPLGLYCEGLAAAVAHMFAYSCCCSHDIVRAHAYLYTVCSLYIVVPGTVH